MPRLHAIGENARNLVGPQLNGIIGRKAGSVEGFPYSEANKTSGVTWDEATFLKYIKDPKAAMPGNKMAFAGIKGRTGRERSLRVPSRSMARTARRSEIGLKFGPDPQPRPHGRGFCASGQRFYR